MPPLPEVKSTPRGSNGVWMVVKGFTPDVPLGAPVVKKKRLSAAPEAAIW